MLNVSCLSTMFSCRAYKFWFQCDSCSFRKTWGCGATKTEKDIAAYNVIREQHCQLGPMSFGEISVLGLFVLLVILWFSRDPGFVHGWATDLNSNAECVLVHFWFCTLTQINTWIRLITEFPFSSYHQDMWQMPQWQFLWPSCSLSYPPNHHDFVHAELKVLIQVRHHPAVKELHTLQCFVSGNSHIYFICSNAAVF